MRRLLKRIIVWALTADKPKYDPVALDKIAAGNK